MTMADVDCVCGHPMSKHDTVKSGPTRCVKCSCIWGPAQRDDLTDIIEELEAQRDELARAVMSMETSGHHDGFGGECFCPDCKLVRNDRFRLTGQYPHASEEILTLVRGFLGKAKP